MKEVTKFIIACMMLFLTIIMLISSIRLYFAIKDLETTTDNWLKLEKTISEDRDRQFNQSFCALSNNRTGCVYFSVLNFSLSAVNITSVRNGTESDYQGLLDSLCQDQLNRDDSSYNVSDKQCEFILNEEVYGSIPRFNCTRIVPKIYRERYC